MQKASKGLRVFSLALVPSTSCSQELAPGKAPPEASVMLSLSYGSEKYQKKIFFGQNCHNSDGLTEPVHLEADVKQGTIQLKRDWFGFGFFFLVLPKYKKKRQVFFLK